MKAEQVEQILEALERSCQQMNGMSIDQSISEAGRILQNLMDTVSSMKSKEHLQSVFLEIEETDENAQVVIAVFGMLPSIARLGIEHMAEQAQEDLPGQPTGRPQRLSHQRKLAVIEFISELQKHKVSQDAAYLRACQKFGIGKSTAKRIWSQRDQLLEQNGPVQIDQRFILQFAKKELFG